MTIAASLSSPSQGEHPSPPLPAGPTERLLHDAAAIASVQSFLTRTESLAFSSTCKPLALSHSVTKCLIAPSADTMNEKTSKLWARSSRRAPHVSPLIDTRSPFLTESPQEYHPHLPRGRQKISHAYPVDLYQPPNRHILISAPPSDDHPPTDKEYLLVDTLTGRTIQCVLRNTPSSAMVHKVHYFAESSPPVLMIASDFLAVGGLERRTHIQFYKVPPCPAGEETQDLTPMPSSYIPSMRLNDIASIGNWSLDNIGTGSCIYYETRAENGKVTILSKKLGFEVRSNHVSFAFSTPQAIPEQEGLQQIYCVDDTTSFSIQRRATGGLNLCIHSLTQVTHRMQIPYIKTDETSSVPHIRCATSKWVLFNIGLIYHVETDRFIRIDPRVQQDYLSHGLTDSNSRIHNDHLILARSGGVDVINMLTGELVSSITLPSINKRAYNLLDVQVDVEKETITVIGRTSSLIRSFIFSARSARPIDYATLAWRERAYILPSRLYNTVHQRISSIIQNQINYLTLAWGSIQAMHFLHRIGIYAALFIPASLPLLLTQPLAGFLYRGDNENGMAAFRRDYMKTPLQTLAILAQISERYFERVSSLRTFCDFLIFIPRAIIISLIYLGTFAFMSPLLLLPLARFFNPMNESNELYKAVNHVGEYLARRVEQIKPSHHILGTTLSSVVCITRIASLLIPSIGILLSTGIYCASITAFNMITLGVGAIALPIGAVALSSIVMIILFLDLLNALRRCCFIQER